MVTKGKRQGGINQECVINTYTLLYTNSMNKKNLPYRTKNFTRNFVNNT